MINLRTREILTHPYVEIAGVKWATMNLGALSETDIGLFFKWGDTQGIAREDITNATFYENNYKFYNSSRPAVYSKYNNYDDKTPTLRLEDDAINVAWGGNWRIPSNDECLSLVNNTTQVWTDNYKNSGKSGFILTDNSNPLNTLFFPSGSYYSSSSFNSKIVTLWSDCMYYTGSGTNINIPAPNRALIIVGDGIASTPTFLYVGNNVYGSDYKYVVKQIRGVLRF